MASAPTLPEPSGNAAFGSTPGSDTQILMTRANVLIAVAIAALTITLWALINRPESEPEWPTKINGFSFSPLREDNDPAQGSYPTREEIDEDLKLLSGKANEVRTYSLDGTLADVPELARKYNIKVTLGAWLDHRLDYNQQQLETLIGVYAAQRTNIRRVIVGNEALYRDQLTVDQLIAYLDWVRARIVAPISTAETPSIWLEHPELADHV